MAERLVARAPHACDFGIDVEGPRELDPVAIGKQRIAVCPTPENGKTERGRIESVLIDEARPRDGIGDRCAGGQFDLDGVLHLQRGPDDGNVHAFPAYTASAR